MEEPLGCYFHFGLLTIRWQYNQGDRSGLRKQKKDKQETLIKATTRIHLPNPVSTDLTKSYPLLINPVWKDGVQGWPM